MFRLLSPLSKYYISERGKNSRFVNQWIKSDLQNNNYDNNEDNDIEGMK